MIKAANSTSTAFAEMLKETTTQSTASAVMVITRSLPVGVTFWKASTAVTVISMAP
jgi:hypothetical protein